MKMKKGQKSLITIKVDFKKAYDKLDWNFLQDTLVDLGFNNHFI